MSDEKALDAFKQIGALDIAIVHPVYGGTEQAGTECKFKEGDENIKERGQLGSVTVNFGFGPTTRKKLNAFRQRVSVYLEMRGVKDKFVKGDYFLPLGKIDEVLAKEPEFAAGYRKILDDAVDVAPDLKDETREWTFWFNIKVFGVTPSIRRRAERAVADAIQQSVDDLEEDLGKVGNMEDATRDKWHAKLAEVEKLNSSPLVRQKLAMLRVLIEEKTRKEEERVNNVLRMLSDEGEKLYNGLIDAQAKEFVDEAMVAALEKFNERAKSVAEKYRVEGDPRLKGIIDNISAAVGSYK